jgi:uncharacterized protein (TIGR04562 family)
MQAVIGGHSAIDVPRMTIRSLDGAEAFLVSYGLPWSEAASRRDLALLRSEAIAFLDEEMLRGLGDLRIPPVVRDEHDIRRLLLMASREDPDETQLWACSMLRVMHTLAHARSPLADRFGPEIREQILGRFEPHLRLGAGGLQLGKGREAVPLVRFEAKPPKPLRSVTLKLLHKVENVASDIFDRIGVRFVTRERFDALLVVRYLRTHHVMMFANIKPSRSRNTLIDMDWIKCEVDRLEALVEAGEITEAQRTDTLRALVRERPLPDVVVRSDNPFSAVDYRSIQFTCRQWIRVMEGPDTQDLGFFFPFEVQILDQDAWEQSRSGLAAHDIYKARQREAVRRRVLGRLLD